MLLRKKISLSIFTIFIVLFGVLFFVLFITLDRGFGYLEKDSMINHLNRVDDSMELIFDSYESKILDWGEWDEAYDFNLENSSFVEDYFNSISLVNLDVGVIFFTDLEGKFIDGYGYDLVNDVPDLATIDFLKEELKNVYFRNYFLQSDLNQGIVLAPKGSPPMILLSKKVLRNDKSGPAEKFIFMARYLDDEFLNYNFKDKSLNSISLKRLDAPNLPSDFVIAGKKIIANNEFLIEPKDSSIIYAYSLFNDYFDSPAFVVKIEVSRPLFNYRNILLGYIFASFSLVVFFFILLFRYVIIKIFLSRLTSIFNKVIKYRENKKSELSDMDFTVSGKDELSELSKEFNNLFKEIVGSRDFYKNLLSRLPEMVILIKDGKALYVNDSFERITKYDKKEILGKSILTFVSEKDRDMVISNMKLRFSGQDVPPYNIGIITKEDSVVMRVNAKIINYHGETVDLVLLTDVTGEIKSSKQIEEKITQLEQMNKVMIDREAKMIELKDRIKKLENS